MRDDSTMAEGSAATLRLSREPYATACQFALGSLEQSRGKARQSVCGSGSAHCYFCSSGMSLVRPNKSIMSLSLTVAFSPNNFHFLYGYGWQTVYLVLFTNYFAIVIFVENLNFHGWQTVGLNFFSNSKIIKLDYMVTKVFLYYPFYIFFFSFSIPIHSIIHQFQGAEAPKTSLASLGRI